MTQLAGQIGGRHAGGLTVRVTAWLVVVGLALSGCASTTAQKPSDDSLGAVYGAGDVHGVATRDEPSVKPAHPPLHGFSRQPSLREARVIPELMHSAERVRNLRFARTVPVLVQDRERITAYVESQIEEDDLERARVVYTALDLLPASLDVRALLLRLMGEQIVGYYDADAKSLCVRDDVMRAFAEAEADDDGELGEARIVLVHELVHALQDQNLGLSAHIHEKRDTDADNAFHALVEGDATLAMIAYALEREQIPLHKLTGNPAQVRSLSDVVRRTPLAGTELEQAPAILRVPLLSAYVDGLSFCASLHGASGWSAVDRAHTNPPRSTEEVLHPERFAHRVAPGLVNLPELPAIAAAGYRRVQEDTLGELEMGVYFSQGADEAQGREAADGWEADRLRVYEAKDKGAAVVWASRWHSEHDADQAEHAARRVQELSAPPVRARSEVLRRGHALLILRNLPDDLRAALRAAFSQSGFTADPPAALAAH